MNDFIQNKLFVSSELLSNLQVNHGFSTRIGGVSLAPYASLNLSAQTGDHLLDVQQNIHRLAQKANLNIQTFRFIKQIHGDKIVWIEDLLPQTEIEQADALITNHQLTLVVKYADCVPILMTDGKGTVAAVHSGWRGTVLNIAGQTVKSLSKRSVSPQTIKVAIGPCIGPCCFIVQKDVAQKFKDLGFKKEMNLREQNQYQVDLIKINQQLLIHAGVLAHHIDTIDFCTSCHTELFFSNRRDGTLSGRHFAFIQGG